LLLLAPAVVVLRPSAVVATPSPNSLSLQRLRKEIDAVQSQRELFRRKRRERETLPLVALVGYTNAGKSSLLNALVGSTQVACLRACAAHVGAGRVVVSRRAAEAVAGVRVSGNDGGRSPTTRPNIVPSNPSFL